jgi:metabolite-proton symporter
MATDQTGPEPTPHPDHTTPGTSTDRETHPRMARRAALASLVGTAIEWYDYFIFGSAAALVFGHVFFPDSSPLMGTLSSFAVFGVGFLARPLGGVIFGHMGDRVGRKRALVITLMITGLSTAAIGVLPTAETAGIWAPVLLVALRLVQGFGLGGEWGGAVLVAVETAPEGKRGRYGAFPQMGNAIGVVLSTGAFALVSLLPDDQFQAWGWRLPFLASLLLVAIGLVIRLRLTETPAFQRLRESAEIAASPFKEVVTTHRGPILLATGMRIAENVLGYIILTFTLSYATKQVGLERSGVLLATACAAAVGIGTTFLLGMLSDNVGRRPVFFFGAVFTAAMAFPYFWMLNSGSGVLVWLAIVAYYAIGIGAQYGIEPAYFAELFDTRVRYSGISIASQVASIVAGGLTPTVATALLAWADGAAWPVALYIILAAVITMVALAFAKETVHTGLRGAGRAARSSQESRLTA